MKKEIQTDLNNKRIKLTQNKYAIIDAEDYKKLSKHKWFYNHGYALRTITYAYHKRRPLQMHRVIINAPDNLEVDHINGNKLDNRKENLRLCTSAQNSHNTKVRKGLFKGVSWHKENNTWRAAICFKYRTRHLGYFKNIREAALAYNKAAVQIFGEFARLNKIGGEL